MRGYYLTLIFFILALSILNDDLNQFQVSAKPVTQDNIDQLKKEGQFFTIRISAGEPVRIYVLGKEEGKFDPSKLSLTIRRLKPYPGKDLAVDRFDNYFLVYDSKEFKKSTDLEITTKMQDTDEVFKFKFKKGIP